MTVADDLRAAKALIDTPEKWCQGSYHEGGFHGFDRRCTLGAVMAATPNFEDRDNVREALLQQLSPKDRLRPHCIATFNDEHPHSDVMALFDRAIAAAEEPADAPR